jgi:hypothetical protein
MHSGKFANIESRFYGQIIRLGLRTESRYLNIKKVIVFLCQNCGIIPKQKIDAYRHRGPILPENM